MASNKKDKDNLGTIPVFGNNSFQGSPNVGVPKTIVIPRTPATEKVPKR